MTSPRQLHLGAFMRPASIHTGAWRYPGAWPDMNFNLPHLKQSIQALESLPPSVSIAPGKVRVQSPPSDTCFSGVLFTPFTARPLRLIALSSRVPIRYTPRRNRRPPQPGAKEMVRFVFACLLIGSSCHAAIAATPPSLPTRLST